MYLGQITDIQHAVAARFGLRVGVLYGPRRDHHAVKPRMLAMYLARKLTERSLPKIGARFSRDHTTVLYAIRKMEKMLAADPALRAVCKQVCADLGVSDAPLPPLEVSHA